MSQQLSWTIVVVAVTLSASLSLVHPASINESMFPTSVTLVGIFAGVLIGSSGVFLSSLSRLTEVIRDHPNIDSDARETIASRIRKSTEEIKDNAILLVIIAAILFVFNVANSIVTPTSATDSTPIVAHVVLNALAAGAITLSFLVTIDTVIAMFRINEHFLWIPSAQSRISNHSASDQSDDDSI